MVADEISMHYCHPVADSSTSVCAAMCLLPAAIAVESDAGGLLYFLSLDSGFVYWWEFWTPVHKIVCYFTSVQCLHNTKMIIACLLGFQKRNMLGFKP